MFTCTGGHLNFICTEGPRVEVYSSSSRNRPNSPPPPPPPSRFDTHLRWPPVMQSLRSRRSYGKIGECEQSGNLDEFLFTDHKFASAGREDIDVLMLGRGKSE